MMLRSKILIALGVSALALCFLVCWREFGKASQADSDHSVGTGAVVTTGHVKDNSESKATPPRKPLVVTSRLDVKTQSFDSSTDLAGFVAENSDRAMNGDATAALLISKAYAECAPFGIRPNDAQEYVTSMKAIFASALTPSEVAAFDVALNKSSTRCKSLQSGPLTGHEAHQWGELAKLNGDLSARASTLIAQHQNPAGINQVVKDVVVAQDTYAMSAMGDAMISISPESRVTFGTLLQGADAPFAWKLAACELGNDCGADSVDLRTICLSSGHCGYQNLEEVYEQLLSPAQLRQVIALQESIVAHIKGGDYSGFSMSTEK
jgi:hypothetical protein